MRRKGDLPELLAPAGSYEALKAAIWAGADAVYFGGSAFGARAYAKNFADDELARAVRLCHVNRVKAYVTVNTLIYDREAESALELVRRICEAGADALIVADIGLVRRSIRHFPQIAVHASTQACANSTDGVNMLAAQGAERVVLARECSYEDICSAVDASDAEIEVFVHGALCVSHSGQCLFSSMVGGRSGNRGECAQPCRLPYGGRYPLSLRDLCLAGHIKQLISCGVSSLKIEGRMKSPEYVYHTASIYRRLLDERRDATPEEMRRLSDIFCRGDSFTDGYFTGRIAAPMTGVRGETEKEKTRALEAAPTEPKTVAVTAKCEILPHTPMKFSLKLGEREVTAVGDTPGDARTIPLCTASVKDRLCRTADSFYTLSPDDISLTLGQGLYLSPGQINAVRRSAIEALDRSFAGHTAEPVSVSLPSVGMSGGGLPRRTAYFHDPGVYFALDRSTREYFDAVCFPLERLEECREMPGCVLLPPVIYDSERKTVKDMLCRAAERGVTCAAVGNIGHLPLVREVGLEAVGTHRLNITNRFAAEYFCEQGIRDYTVSAEATLPRARDLGGRVIVYGRIPLMLTERCFVCENGGCERCGSACLCDRTGAVFPMVRTYPHRNEILNSLPTYMGDREKLLLTHHIKYRQYLFYTESPEEIRQMTEAEKKGQPLDCAVRRINREN